MTSIMDSFILFCAQRSPNKLNTAFNRALINQSINKSIDQLNKTKLRSTQNRIRIVKN